MINRITLDLEAALALHRELVKSMNLHKQLVVLAGMCLDALRGGGKIILAGNGGSFADAQHLAAEFTSRLQFNRPPLAAIALGTNSSAITAIGNDYGFKHVFARELSVLAGPKDVFIPISTSGNSPNILAAVKVAKQQLLRTMGFSGECGGKLSAMCPCLCIPSRRTERVQEGHILLGHILCGLVEEEIYGAMRRKAKDV